VAVPPFTFAQFDRPIFEADGKTPTFAMQTLKAQFQAPPQAGHYTFVMHVVCDSYVGFDTKMEVTLIVEEASKAAEMEEEEDISEPEEGEFFPFFPSCSRLEIVMLTIIDALDSIAGIMNAAKGGAPPKRRKQVKSKPEEDDSDEESGTEEEQDDTSATNTDTEPEDN
jgi:translocation protein SEC63